MISAPASPTSTLAGLDDQLHDARRVLAQGQEEDLRHALDRVIIKVEELSSLLRTAIKTQRDLETQLIFAKSNLQLVISNNEMLEEALKRETPCNAKDVGWRRWSAREVQNYNAGSKPEDRPRSLDYGPLNDSGKPAVPSSAVAVLVSGVKTTPSTPQITNQENRFFKFRFTSGNTRSPTLSPHTSHLTSPSLSSLVPNAREKEIDDLQEQLERERQAHKTTEAAKAELEAELESLSQALFEEANKMVATERMKRAETEEELNQARLEKDALRQALELVEGENGLLRSASISSAPALDQSDPSQPSVVIPLRSSPQPSSPQSQSTTTTSTVSPSVAPSYDVPSHVTGFVLGPAPKPPLAGLHRKTASMVRVGTTELSVNSLEDALPVILASPPVPLLADDPSPWAS